MENSLNILLVPVTLTAACNWAFLLSTTCNGSSYFSTYMMQTFWITGNVNEISKM